MRILLINGNTSPEITERIAVQARRVASHGAEVRAVTAEFGARLILSRADNAIAAHAVLAAFARHCGGCDAAVVAVGTDAGLQALRQCAPIPVVGMTEAALLTASMIGGKFGLLVFDKRAVPMFREVVAMHGQTDRMAGAVAVPMTPADFADPKRVRGEVLGAINRLIEEMAAESVVITGATTAMLAESLQRDVSVPLLDGISCGVLQTQLLVRLGRPEPRIGNYVGSATQEYLNVDPAVAELLRPTEGPKE
ncbi:MAG: aspartate/glutamate racemase family protein [Hyphomicrobiaceae bacterium]